MSISTSPILGGIAQATKAQALAYLLSAPGRKVTDAEAAQIVDAYLATGAREGIAWDKAFAQSCHETARFTFPNQVPIAAHNPAGIGAINDGKSYRTFADWPTGIAMQFYHLQAWAHAPGGERSIRYKEVTEAAKTKGYAVTFGDLGGRWAVPGDGYGVGLDRHHAGILAMPKETNMAPRIALAAGHKNSSGGDAFEKEQTGPLCAAVAKHCRALGMDVRVVQPDDGMGTIAGSLDVVGNTVVGWDKAGWTPDIFLECHTEGGGGVGAFAIYPDWQGDVDADVRDTLGPDVARRIAAATGLGLGAGGDGVMSERQTGVGASGSRLGIFRTTAPLAASTTRLIIEYGAHDRQPDQGIAESPGFYDRCGQATAEAFAEFLAWSVPDSSTTPPPPQPDPGIVTPQTAWGGAGEIVSYEQILVVRDPASGQVSQKRQIDFTFVGDWVQLTK